MELSLKGSGITYEPGDAIGVRCPNPPNATAYVLERLQVSVFYLFIYSVRLELVALLYYHYY